MMEFKDIPTCWSVPRCTKSCPRCCELIDTNDGDGVNMILPIASPTTENISSFARRQSSSAPSAAPVQQYGRAQQQLRLPAVLPPPKKTNGSRQNSNRTMQQQQLPAVTAAALLPREVFNLLPRVDADGYYRLTAREINKLWNQAQTKAANKLILPTLEKDEEDQKNSQTLFEKQTTKMTKANEAFRHTTTNLLLNNKHLLDRLAEKEKLVKKVEEKKNLFCQRHKSTLEDNEHLKTKMEERIMGIRQLNSTVARQEFTLQSLESDVTYQSVINERQKLENLKLKTSVTRLESENVELRTDMAILKRDMNDLMTMLNQRK